MVTTPVAPDVQVVDTVAEPVRPDVAFATIGSYAPKFKSGVLMVQDAMMSAETVKFAVASAGTVSAAVLSAMVDMIARLSDLWPIFLDTLLLLFANIIRM